MRLSPAQSRALRFGAAMAVLASFVLAFVAITVDSGSPGTGDVRRVQDPSSIRLPDPGLFGSTVTVYGAARGGDAGPAALGCRLLDRDGHEQSTAKMSELSVLSTDPVTVQGTTLQPLFSVRSYPAGSVVACDAAASVAPVAVSRPSTFGSLGLVVRLAAGVGAVVALVVGITGWFVFRPSSR